MVSKQSVYIKKRHLGFVIPNLDIVYTGWTMIIVEVDERLVAGWEQVQE